MKSTDFFKEWQVNTRILESFPVEPQNLCAIAEKIAKNQSVLSLQPPKPLTLEKANSELLQYIEKDNFHAIPTKLWKKIPWLLFYSSPYLVSYPQFYSALVNWLSSRTIRAQAKFLQSLFFILLDKYDPEDKNFQKISVFIKELLEKNSHPNSLKITNILKRYECFTFNDNKNTAQLESIFKNTHFKYILTDLQLPTYCHTGKYIQFIAKCYMNEISQKLHSSGNLAFINIFFEEYTDEVPSRIFSSLSNTFLIEQLLNPFTLKNSFEFEYKEAICNFILKHYGDPRIQVLHWASVHHSSRRVMNRWLVERQLELFFEILKETAPDQWQERQRFWNAYLSANHIHEAWVIMGRSAHLQAKRLHLDQKLYGLLKGGLPDQSVLLMRLENLIIVEWSHSGSCRICSPLGVRQLIPLYKQQYESNDLRPEVPANYKFVHHGSWKEKISTCISQETGIYVGMESKSFARRYWS